MTTSIWGRIKQAYSNSNRATGEGEGLYTRTVTLSNARMKTLRATPYIVVHGISNRIIVPTRVVATSTEASTSRTGSVDVQVQWHRGGSSYTDASGDIDRSTMHGSITDVRFAVENCSIDIGGTFDMENKDVVLRNVDGSEYGSGSSDNEVTFRVTYYVVKA